MRADLPAPSDLPMRLAYLLSRYPAVNHTYLFNEVKHLRELGVDVRVASVLPPDRLTPEETAESARTFYVKPGGLRLGVPSHLATLLSRPRPYFRGLFRAIALSSGAPASVLRWVFYFADAVVVGRWMLAQGVSHLHVHYASNVGLLVSAVFPVSVSYTMHGPAEFDDPAGFRLARKISGALFVRAISSYGRSQLMRAAPASQWDKLEVVRLGVDPALFHPALVRPQPSPWEIVSVGRLSPEKGQHVLLDAVERLLGEGCRLRLRLVGDGPDRAELERRASAGALAGHVVFEGWTPAPRVRELYAQADICAMPSFQEGIPVALMEAMAAGIPCVASRITGIPELIRDGVHGLLVTPSDPVELASAIARLMGHSALRQSIAEAARRRILEEYDFGKNIVALESVFERRCLCAG